MIVGAAVLGKYIATEEAAPLHRSSAGGHCENYFLFG
jgi:hypothetical protein